MLEGLASGVGDPDVILSFEPQCEAVSEGYLVVDEEDSRRVFGSSLCHLSNRWCVEGACLLAGLG